LASTCASCEYNKNIINSMCQVCLKEEKTCWTCKHKYQCDPDDLFKCKEVGKKFYAQE